MSSNDSRRRKPFLGMPMSAPAIDPDQRPHSGNDAGGKSAEREDTFSAWEKVLAAVTLLLVVLWSLADGRSGGWH